MADMRKVTARLRGGAHARAGGLASVVRENPLLAAVAGIGFSVSFQTIAELARTHGLPGPSMLYPVGIDVGILALIAEGLWLIREGRSDFVPRVLAWALTGMTIFINVHGARLGDRVGQGLHAVMPALWVICLELVRRRRVAAVARPDGIPAGRWVAAPWPTLMLWLRMRRDGVTSYPLALELEQARWFARDLIRATPEQYRPHRSSLVCKRIRSGRLREDVRKAVAGSLGNEWAPGWEGPVTEWVTDAIGLTERLAASLENTRRDMTRATLEAIPEVTLEVTPQATPEATPEAPVQATPETVPSQAPSHPEVTVPVKPAARSRRKVQATPRRISDTDLKGLIRPLFDADPDVSVNAAAKQLSRSRDRVRPLLEEVRNEARREAHVIPMERRA